MFEFNSGLMTDDWGSVDYLFGDLSPISMQPSGFFPTPQASVPLRTELLEPAVSLGQARPLATDAPSLAETASWFKNNWLDSPYESELARPSVPPPPSTAIMGPPYYPKAAVPAQEPGMLGQIAGPWENAFDFLWGEVKEVVVDANKQLPNILLAKYGLGTTTQVVNTRGDTETNVQSKAPMSLATIPGLKQEQPQYLFNIGYEGQPTPTVVPIRDSGKGGIAISPLLLIAGLFLFGR